MTMLLDAKKKSEPKVRPNRKHNGMPRIQAFHPTKEERDHLADSRFDLEWAIDKLNTVGVDKHAKVTMSYKDDNDAWCVIIREEMDDWQQAQALSCFHADLCRAIIGLAYALAHRYNEWPSNSAGAAGYNNDW